MLSNAGELAEARKMIHAALSLWQKLVDANPSIATHRSELARGQDNLSQLLSAAGKLADARKANEAALAIRQKLAEAYPQ